MKRNRVFCVILFFTILTSCGSYKNIPYFQDINSLGPIEDDVKNYSPYVIQPGDILGISVTSRNPEASAIFNYNLSRQNGNENGTVAQNPVIGWLVDQEGNIHLPQVGDVKVAGATAFEIRKKLNTILLDYLKDPVVNLRIINSKISIFGDVLRPNVYPIQDERITITQALSLAGDLNITAVRKNILLIREENGKRKIIPLDLTSKNLFQSPYYYLKNNDEIYVQPDRTKYATVDRGYRIATLVLTGLSIAALVFVYRR